jgi:uncharacterized protein YndB with AHSA1/START domain
MARIEERVDIKRPVDRVFAYTTDASSWPRWQSVIVEAAQTSEGPFGTGATFEGTNHMMGRTMRWTAKAGEYEPNRSWGKRIVSDGMTIEEHLKFEPTEGGTSFTLVYDMTASGFLKLLSPVIAGYIRRETKKSLGNLKRILEAEA